MHRKARESEDPGLLTPQERQDPRKARYLRLLHGLVLVGIFVAGAGPVLWLVAASLGTTQQTLRQPMSVLGNLGHWENYTQATSGVDTIRLIRNSVIAALGSMVMTVLIALSAGYVIAVLRPKWAPVFNAGILTTIFIPSVVSLVPLYLTVVDLFGTGLSLQNTFWAVWLPAGANAFSVLLTTSYLRGLPRELCEAASLDGAGPIRTMVWVVLPLCRPILGVVALLAAIGSWKDYLWPSLVLSDPTLRPVSVALPAIEKSTELSTFLAALVLASIIPIVVFMIFQRQLLSSAGFNAGVKD
ncbi:MULTISPECIES: carbohydrate ABC transporter permease [unclassified Micromonospora]|uniref:carbohydrate ABC transporter permease n=1 Tax=unclassified Micromonospora TaxID=2617518 RepID=UPI003643CB32